MSMLALFLLLALSSSVTAFPLPRVVNLARMEDEESGTEGHLSHSWVVAVAVSLVVILLALTVTVLVVKLRQRRKRSAASRRRRNYSRTSDELVAAPEQPYEHVWRGPYASRASYTRSPSPPSPAHLSEKDKWAQPQR
ncbi:hypothetical protein GSI_14112 [Ganoderma sinense ZZ0214-1]|uniref:Transporter n=1 Tax=Ganoderma sinense ZZ0214-1 TaxID=1077348 RepID=A0A2G8RS65_9APHY|nr:hypothetical protein GSI_14112 [Ganoderma sinense ZZ0214-1]